MKKQLLPRKNVKTMKTSYKEKEIIELKTLGGISSFSPPSGVLLFAHEYKSNNKVTHKIPFLIFKCKVKFYFQFNSSFRC